jgi:hypothetical protein
VKTRSQSRAREMLWRYPERENGACELVDSGAKLGWLRFGDQHGAETVVWTDGSGLSHLQG